MTLQLGGPAVIEALLIVFTAAVVAAVVVWSWWEDRQ
jgi:type II secretory pathway component PulK